MNKYFPPAFEKTSFTCPHCYVVANQKWSSSISVYHSGNQAYYGIYKGHPRLSFSIAICAHCEDISIWRNTKMIYPDKSPIEEANPDLPEDIKLDYDEAKEILSKSPRSAAALLRLALQKLLEHVGEKGKSINEAIKSLVQRGLPQQFQQALDSIRVVGNSAVHPGQIDFNDNPEIARALFGLLNIICDYFITQPKKIAEIYGSLPEKDLDIIAKRDSKLA